MPDRCVAPLICPVCRLPLSEAGSGSGRSLGCHQGHNYDVAREGYVNLLTGHKKRAIQGDSRAMLLARRAFLAANHYAKLSAAIVSRLGLDGRSSNPEPYVIADVGCGEGYYLGQLYQSVTASAPARPVCLLGLDLSRDAVRLAARLVPDAQFAVADTHRLIPLATGSVALILNVFAPRNPAEFARVLAPGGRLLVVLPGPDHLAELRQALPLLAIEPDKSQQVTAQLAAFRLVESAAVRFSLSLSGEAVQQLVQMTPSAWHLGEAEWAAVAALGARDVTADFQLLHFGA